MKPHATVIRMCDMYDFISHMVQMKLSPLSNFWKTSIFFISHMVQMKQTKAASAISILQSLYPTWFRWNVGSLILRSIPFVLYIPHGSDETNCGFSISCVNLSFISHMVQMKQHSLQNPYLTVFPLYPTWFRWNLEETELAKS